MSVYFAKDNRTGFIKIGFSRFLWQRLASLGSKKRIVLLGQIRGGSGIEHSLHEKFRDHRATFRKGQGREWFFDVPEIRDYIKEIGADKPRKTYIPTAIKSFRLPKGTIKRARWAAYKGSMKDSRFATNAMEAYAREVMRKATGFWQTLPLYEQEERIFPS